MGHHRTILHLSFDPVFFGNPFIFRVNNEGLKGIHVDICENFDLVAFREIENKNRSEGQQNWFSKERTIENSTFPASSYSRMILKKNTIEMFDRVDAQLNLEDPATSNLHSFLNLSHLCRVNNSLTRKQLAFTAVINTLKIFSKEQTIVVTNKQLLIAAAATTLMPCRQQWKHGWKHGWNSTTCSHTISAHVDKTFQSHCLPAHYSVINS